MASVARCKNSQTLSYLSFLSCSSDFLSFFMNFSVFCLYLFLLLSWCLLKLILFAFFFFFRICTILKICQRKTPKEEEYNNSEDTDNSESKWTLRDVKTDKLCLLSSYQPNRFKGGLKNSLADENQMKMRKLEKLKAKWKCFAMFSIPYYCLSD